jgi:galactokinase
MDPMACSLCEERSALFLDTQSLHVERVPIPDAAEIVVISSGIAHSNATGDYRIRRAECERAAQELGVPSLRALDMDQLDRLADLPELLARRVRHVVTENDRVLRALDAMRREDVRALGELFDASHASMRDDYEVSIPQIDRLVSLARATPQVYGARLTGGGFGGSVVILAARGAGRDVAASVAREFAASSPVTPRVLVPQTE